MRKSLLLALFLSLLPAVASAQTLPEPREGLDYEVLATPQPTLRKGGIEVAEVFSYGCIHCANFQPFVNAWRKKASKDVRWEYVPAAFGGVQDNFARAYLAAESLGVLKKTHDAVFKGVFVDKAITSGSLDELADLYATFGVDRARFLAAMNSDATTARLAAARDFSLRTGIDGTPTLIINGKYRLKSRAQTGFEGMLRTADFLIVRERAAARAKPKD